MATKAKSNVNTEYGIENIELSETAALNETSQSQSGTDNSVFKTPNSIFTVYIGPSIYGQVSRGAIFNCTKPSEKINKRKDLSRKGILAMTYDNSDKSGHDAVREILQQLQIDTSGGIHPNNLF